MKHGTHYDCHVVNKSQFSYWTNKVANRKHQHRILGFVKMAAMVSIALGLFTSIMGSVLVTSVLGQPTFSFSTGLPLLVGIMELIGSTILCCISMKLSSFTKYTSPYMCKWQCALLCFCHLGVVCLGTASIILSIFDTDVGKTLVKDPSKLPMFPLGIGSTLLVALDVVLATCSLWMVCVYSVACGRCSPAYYYPAIQHNDVIEREINYRLMMLRQLLPVYTSGRLGLHRQEGAAAHAAHAPRKTRHEPHVDRKGYYVWEHA